jgi:hypothetical protein
VPVCLQIISKRLYILRLTISRATYRLVPTLMLLVTTLVAFAVFGNQLYNLTTPAWQDMPSSLGKVLYLMRRPMGMDWDRMAQSNIMWPLDSDEPNPLTIIFLLGFTIVTIWVMANLVRSIIIIEYSTVVQAYRKKPPGDLTSDPWPSFNPLDYYNARKERLKQVAHEQRLKKRQSIEWRVLRTAQKKKQALLREHFRRQQSESPPKKREDPDEKTGRLNENRGGRLATAAASS